MSYISQGLLHRRRDSGGTDWRNYAACLSVDPDLFFPLGTSGASLLQIDEAKQICRTCPVCGPCLRWALESGDAGVWAAPRRTSGASTGSALSESSGEANSGRFLKQPAHVFTISLFPCACPVMVAGVFAYAKQPVIGMGSS